MLSAASRQFLRCSRQTTFVAATQTRNKYTLPELPYKYNALEPVISGEIMELHHSKHHATYVNNLNAAEEKLKQAIEDGKFVNSTHTHTHIVCSQPPAHLITYHNPSV